MDKCNICENDLTIEWTDLHGVGRCYYCNSQYKIFHYDENRKRIDMEPELTLKEKYIPLYKRYWNTFHRRTGDGTYFMFHPNHDDAKAFNDWLKKEIENGNWE